MPYGPGDFVLLSRVHTAGARVACLPTTAVHLRVTCGYRACEWVISLGAGLTVWALQCATGSVVLECTLHRELLVICVRLPA